MTENINENGNSEIPEVEDLVIDDGDDVEVIKQKTTDWKKAVTERNDKVNKQLFARTKKAEGFVPDGKGGWVKAEAKPKEDNAGATQTPKDNLTTNDVFTLVKAGIEEVDIPDIVEYATLKKISIAEALKSPIVKNILAEKTELRKTAEGAHTGNGSRGSGRLSDEALLKNASEGNMPESEDDITRLAAIRMSQKKNKNKK